jgi:hypothetical protein
MDLSIRARAAVAIFSMATFGFNPGQKRGPDGRFIKMGGRGSAGKGGLPKGARPSEDGGAGAGGGAGIPDVRPTPTPPAVAPPRPAPAAAATPEIGPDGQYTKPVKQVATWNGQVETRTSRHPYKYVSIVQFGDDEPVILSWHRTRAAAEKGTLTKNQRDNGSRVVAVAEVKPEQPGENASASADAQRLDRLVRDAVARYGPDELQWPARARQDAARLRKKLATMSSDTEVFAMPDDLADYWVRGEGAAKIRWCTEGAFERARRALREHVPAPMLDGTVANLYKRACGKWPGQDRD